MQCTAKRNRHLNNGSAKPVLYDLAGEEFLVGSVPGCDLRLPGTSLPPVVCLITRQPDGVRLRKLAPTLPVLVNGQPVSQNALTPLTHGDVVSVGAVDLHLDIAFTVPAAPQFVPVQQAAPAPARIVTPASAPDFEERTRLLDAEEQTRRQEWVRRQQELDARQRAIDEKEQELEADRVLWYRRREEIERELREARERADRVRPDPEAVGRLKRQQEEAARHEEELKRRERELDRRLGELEQRKADLEAREREAGQRVSADQARQLAELERRRGELDARAQEMERQQSEVAKGRAEVDYSPKE